MIQNGKIFISYRRRDAIHAAGRIRDKLLAAYTDAQVFLDVDSMPLGNDFVGYLQGKVAQCDVLIAIIGPGWLTAEDDHGRRRLDDPDDVVRVEIAAALAQGKTVIPVVLDGAAYPGANQLPEDLRALSRRSGLDIRGTSFDVDVAKLISALEPIVKSGSIPVEAGASTHRQPRWIVPGSGREVWFKDNEAGPEMVVVPAGTYAMGSPSDESGREPQVEDSEPIIECTIDQPFAVSRFPVTVAEFSHFVDATGRTVADGATYWSDTAQSYRHANNRSWKDPRFVQGDDHPVVAVSWHDASDYVTWLGNLTGRRYRLLTSVEWEYVARSGQSTAFHWGHSISSHQANYDARIRYPGGEKGEASNGTVAVKTFEPNAWGLYQVHGNIWEMCSDTLHNDADLQIHRGGSFEDGPEYLRCAMQSWCGIDLRCVSMGFRVARQL